MTDFRPDCTINLHVETRGKPAKISWACSIQHERAGRVVLARKFLGIVSREEAEFSAVLFGIRQASRFLQEKVEIRATFPLEDRLSDKGPGSRRIAPEGKPLREEAMRLWENFRLRRVGKLDGGDALALREEAERAFARRREKN